MQKQLEMMKVWMERSQIREDERTRCTENLRQLIVEVNEHGRCEVIFNDVLENNESI